MRSLLLTAILLPTLLACERREVSARPQGTETADVSPETWALAWPRLPLLPPGVRPAGWPQALERWEEAKRAFETADYERAASGFLAVAHVLDVRPSEPRAARRVRATGRCLAYDNVARVYRAAGRPEQAREALAGPSEDDPACKHTIAQRLSRLEGDRPRRRAVRRAGP